ncbi:MAG: hypothetical protein DRO76_06030 [Candidatus Altiarchaeales archaeon]|nr:MAG: hypothetical protein DRO76_06030 [Candidatus Altiarchaeales archaeon]
MKENSRDIGEPNFDIHKRRARRKSAERLLLEADICKRNKDLILRYVEYRTLAENLSVARQNKYLHYLRILAENLEKPFDKATKQDIEKLLGRIYQRDVYRGRTKKKPSKWTKYDFAVILKTFFKWLKKCEKPKETDWIKPPKPEAPRLRPDEILTWEDIVKLSKASMNSRDLAFPQVLWETGARIEELLTLELRDIERVNNGMALKLHFRKSKTEIRSPIIVRSAPALLNWIEKHPLREYKTAPLWVKIKRRDKPMDYSTARKILKDLKRRSGLDKPVNPHNFRKSSASFYSHYLSPAELKNRYGWRQSSKMLDIYCFPDEERVNGRILEFEGIKERKAKENAKMKPKKCVWCGKINPVGVDYCVLCKRPLDPEKNLLVSQLTEIVDDSIREFAEKNSVLINEFVRFIKRRVEEGMT